MSAPIVAATDGAAPGDAAVRWGAREAVRRGLALCIVYAHPEAHGHRPAAAVLEAAVAEARAAAPDVVAEAVAVPGDPVTALLGQEDAELIVLGNRGRGGFASLLLGSVSQRVATYATVPVVVVRGRAGTPGPVVAGVDDSAPAEDVLAAAFEAAAVWGAPLAVVRCYRPPTPLWVGDIPSVAEVAPAVEAAERHRLEGQLEPWRRRFPQVDAEAVVSPDGAAAVLVAVSHSARLIVVGSRGHSTVTGTVLGSTGMQVLHHAGCPVFIARTAGSRLGTIAA